MCVGGMVCNGEMDIKIIAHTENNGKSRCTSDRICENISKVTLFVMLLFQHTRPSSQEDKWGHNMWCKRDRKVS